MYKCCSLDSSPPSRRVLLVGRSHTMHAPSRGEAPPHTPATTSWMELVAELKVFIPRAIDELQLTHDSHAANLSSWAAALQSTDAEEYLHKFPSVRTKDKALYARRKALNDLILPKWRAADDARQPQPSRSATASANLLPSSVQIRQGGLAITITST